MDVTTINIKDLDIPALEVLVREYPWFAYARQELLSKIAARGKEHVDLQMQRASAFLPDRRAIYLMTLHKQESEESPVIDFEEINREFVEMRRVNEEASTPDVGQKTTPDGPKYIVLGGDYFSKEDFAQVESVNMFKIGKLGDVEEGEGVKLPENQKVATINNGDDLDEFYTETLAAIYAEQGYYEEAIKVYAKLILLYPEKSAYFATLVNEVKSKNN